MLNAVYFTYNDVFSATYGLKIRSFDGESQDQETSLFSPSVSTSKAKDTTNYYIGDLGIGDVPEYEFSIVSDTTINNIAKREILAWLTSGTDFSKLIVHRPDSEDFYYMCKFTNISEISVSGHCVGYKVTALFNSPYQYGKDTVLTIPEGQYLDQEFVIYNKSDSKDEYAYPVVTFNIVSDAEDSSESVSITTDTDEDLHFYFTSLNNGDEVEVDCGARTITGTSVENFGDGEEKDFLRLKKGKNTLTISINGSMTISCPQVVNIGF